MIPIDELRDRAERMERLVARIVVALLIVVASIGGYQLGHGVGAQGAERARRAADAWMDSAAQHDVERLVAEHSRAVADSARRRAEARADSAAARFAAVRSRFRVAGGVITRAQAPGDTAPPDTVSTAPDLAETLAIADTMLAAKDTAIAENHAQLQVDTLVIAAGAAGLAARDSTITALERDRRRASPRRLEDRRRRDGRRGEGRTEGRALGGPPDPAARGRGLTMGRGAAPPHYGSRATRAREIARELAAPPARAAAAPVRSSCEQATWFCWDHNTQQGCREWTSRGAARRGVCNHCDMAASRGSDAHASPLPPPPLMTTAVTSRALALDRRRPG
jgi:hypothetical protein